MNADQIYAKLDEIFIKIDGKLCEGSSSNDLLQKVKKNCNIMGIALRYLVSYYNEMFTLLNDAVVSNEEETNEE